MQANRTRRRAAREAGGIRPDAAGVRARFLATMSHELRTPLNAIVGFSQLLLEGVAGPLGERQRRYVRHVNDSGRHLLELVTDVLDLEALESGAMVTEPVPVGVAAVVEVALARVTPAIRAKAQRVTVDVPAGLQAWADPARLEQVLWNLLTNASKFTPEGGGIAVRAASGGAGVEIEVEDDGIGIAAGDRERVFEPFTQLDSGPSRRQEGTGLGLALARRLLQRMGGSIDVGGAPGSGSIFTVRVPGC